MEHRDSTDGLHSILTARRDEVIQRWKGTVQGTLVPAALSSSELVDHLPVFLKEVIAALRADAGLSSTSSPPEESLTAGEHGEQRLRLGFSLDSVVREYGALRNAILATGRDAGATISLREQQTVFDATVTGIAQAVSQYSRQRDAEVQRQHNEHFAFIAHELRNPLQAACASLGQLKRRSEIQVEARATTTLERGLKRMEELIDDSLNVARVASGIELRTERTDLKTLLADAELTASGEADEKNVTVLVCVESDEALQLDVRLVRSALNNLVRNAVKYSHAGGSIELRGTVTGGRACIEIEDSCGGLPAGKVEEAFAPFVRMNTRESGFGLGLAIAKQAADAHGGSIRVQNLPGKGCVFALELPTGQP